jgi:hypothetical protein
LGQTKVDVLTRHAPSHEFATAKHVGATPVSSLEFSAMSMRTKVATVSMLMVAALSAILAEQWPPTDPQAYSTEVNFTLPWAKRLEGFKTLADLQRAAKTKGKISESSLQGDDPYVAFHWRSEPPDVPEVGYMLATVRPNGKINVSVLTTDKHEVIADNSGRFSVGPAK